MATAKKPQTSRKQAGSAAKKVPLKKTTAPAAPARPITRKAAKPAAKPAEKSAAPKAEKPAKAKKPKLVRDSFTIPKAEYLVLDQLKQRAGTLARPVKKSELLRAGIKALAAMPDAAFLTALANVPAIKTGRPAA